MGNDHWMAPEGVNRIQLFGSKGLAANASANSAAIPVSLYAPSGYFSTYVSVSGAGKLNMRYLSSIDGENFMAPSEASTLLVNFSLASGLPGTLGQDIISFTPVLSKFMKIQIQEVSGTAISATVWLATS